VPPVAERPQVEGQPDVDQRVERQHQEPADDHLPPRQCAEQGEDGEGVEGGDATGDEPRPPPPIGAPDGQ
jgi:hypothetical protein